MGEVSTLNIKNSYNTGKISTKTDYAAGITSYISEGEIYKCYNTGDVSDGQSSWQSYLGGIAGYSYKVDIKRCFNTGNILGVKGHVGGIVGDSYQLIENCYNKGKVTGNGDYVGGIVGNGKDIKNSYNYNKEEINGLNYVGGVAGQASMINNTYNLGEIGISNKTGSDIGSIVGYIYSIDNVKNNAYLSGTYEKGMGGYKEDTDTTTKAIEDIEELYTLINQNLTEADGWVLKEGEKLPTINFEEE